MVVNRFLPVISTCRLVVDAVMLRLDCTCSLYRIERQQQRRLDMRHRTHDYFAFQWPLIDFCAYETAAFVPDTEGVQVSTGTLT